MDVYQRLLDAFGPQHWWPGDGGPFEVCVGAILTQSAAWTNVEKALARLKEAGLLSPQALHGASQDEMAALVYSSGYFNAKARKLKAFAERLCLVYGGDIALMLAQPAEQLRPELLSIHGIGEETADDIVLYAAGQPSFVVDAYTRRIFSRLGIEPTSVDLEPAPLHPKPVQGRRPQRDTYQAWRAMFMEALPQDSALFNEFHALLVALGKDVCLKGTPRCGDCPLRTVCAVGRVS
jgi:endonuclease-3 related protein